MLKYLLLIGICVMIMLAVGIVFFVILYQQHRVAHQLEVKKLNEQKELELIQAAITSEERERLRIASELHDDVNATLASARLFLYKSKDTGYDEYVINQSKELMDESINKIRQISHNLQPVTLQLGLETSLKSLIETINNSGSLSAEYVAKNTLPRIDEQRELAVYRISQELVANIIKHSIATFIAIETYVAKNRIVILVTHDGIGMTQDTYERNVYKKGTTGLKNIVNRLKATSTIIHFFQDGHLYKTKLSIQISTE